MGIAINYLKARFESADAAAEALPRVEAFVRQGVAAHAWWKAHRGLEANGRRRDFWRQLSTAFPDVYASLGLLADGGCNEALLGFLEFGREGTIELHVEGALLYYRAEVWHGGDWDPLGHYLKTRLGALGVDWIGHEPGDFFAMLEP